MLCSQCQIARARELLETSASLEESEELQSRSGYAWA